jgi:hypothetical protein
VEDVKEVAAEKAEVIAEKVEEVKVRLRSEG